MDEFKKNLRASTGMHVFIYLMALLVCSLIGGVLTLWLAAGNDIVKLKIGQGLSSLLIFVAPPLILYGFTRHQPMRAIGFRKPVSAWMLLIGVAVMFASLPVTHQLTVWNEKMSLGAFKALEDLLQQMEEMAGDLTERMLQVDTLPGLLFNLLVIALIPAVGEELTFRGVVQQALVKGCKNAHVGIFLSAAIFSFIHFQFYGFLPRMFLGLLLGYLFYYSGSLWTSILMHFVNNGSAVVVAYFEHRNQIGTSVEDFGATDSPWILAASLAGTVLLINLCSKIKYKYGKQ
ncbi:MAG: CPBP family intramembrane metalloprotease [Bacteroidales bacterium]|nr:CPBP family intramembrane metalloprotease [Bacteroidales bacterium]